MSSAVSSGGGRERTRTLSLRQAVVFDLAEPAQSRHSCKTFSPMDALQTIAPLVGVLVGGALSGITAQLRARKERKRIIAVALADLLEVRHRLLAANLVIEKVATTAGIKAELLPHLRNFVESMEPVDAGLDERYSNAVSLLAGIDPVLAFDLRSKNVLPKVLSALRGIATSGSADLASFEFFESRLLSAVRPTLNRAVVELARAHSIVTAFKVKRRVQQTETIPADIAKFLNEMAALVEPSAKSQGELTSPPRGQTHASLESPAHADR